MGLNQKDMSYLYKMGWAWTVLCQTKSREKNEMSFEEK